MPQTKLSYCHQTYQIISSKAAAQHLSPTLFQTYLIESNVLGTAACFDYVKAAMLLDHDIALLSPGTTFVLNELASYQSYVIPNCSRSGLTLPFLTQRLSLSLLSRIKAKQMSGCAVSRDPNTGAALKRGNATLFIKT